MSLLVDSILAACVLHNICLNANDTCDIPAPEEDEQRDDFARDGHELQGIRIRQELMQQLLNV
jgi:hypothetical protein